MVSSLSISLSPSLPPSNSSPSVSILPPPSIPPFLPPSSLPPSLLSPLSLPPSSLPYFLHGFIIFLSLSLFLYHDPFCLSLSLISLIIYLPSLPPPLLLSPSPTSSNISHLLMINGLTIQRCLPGDDLLHRQ